MSKQKINENYQVCRAGLDGLFEAAMVGDEDARAELVEALAVIMEAAGKIIKERDGH